MDFAGQQQDPAGLSLSTCHVQFPRTRLPGMVYLGYTDCQRAVEVQRLARTDTGSVRHAMPLSIPDRRNRTDKHRSRMFLLYHSRPTECRTHRPYPLPATSHRRKCRHTYFPARDKLGQQKNGRRPKATHRPRLPGERLSQECLYIQQHRATQKNTQP